jgi:protein TonB
MLDQHFLMVGEAEVAAKPRAHVVLAPPKAEPLHEVFAEAMLEDTSAHQHRSPFDWIASIGVHFAVLAVLLIMPLYFTAGLDTHRLNLMFLATPPMPAAPPPPPASSAAPRPARITPARPITPGQLIAPTFIPKVVLTAPDSAGAPPDDSLMGVPGGVPGGIPGGQVGGVFGGIPGGGFKAAPAPVVAEGPKVPVRVGGNVKPPRLLFAPDPEYPVLARQAHLSGVVIIEAIIDEHGKVTGMRLVSGHPILVPSAMSAVSKRRYEPTILDGEATPIDLRVEITFSFS